MQHPLHHSTPPLSHSTTALPHSTAMLPHSTAALPHSAPPTQHYKHHAAMLEDELAGVKMQLAESNRELQKLKAVLAKASHTIQASLQVGN